MPLPPRISIVTHSYNQARYLEECMDSVLSQGYPNLDYIVMDGGSSDGSVEIIKKYSNYLTYWQTCPDGGQYTAINAGFTRSSGEIMTWLNSDAKFHPHALEAVARVFKEHSEVQWLMGRPNGLDQYGHQTGIDYLPSWDREKYLKKQYYGPHLQQEGTFWQRTLWEQAGGYLRSDLQYAGDLELWTRFFRYAQLHSVDLLLAGYRVHPQQKIAQSLAKYNQEAEAVLDFELELFQHAQNKSLLPAPPLIIMDRARQSDEPAPKNRPDQTITVSAIISVYNAEKYIRARLEDLEAQTIADQIEIIVVDSGSEQNERKIVEEFMRRYSNIKYIRTKERETVYAAWNRGIQMAEGRYLTNANADDRLRADAFERMVAVLDDNPAIDLVYADALITITPNETFEQCTTTGAFNWLEPDRNALLYRGCFVGPQPLWRKSLHDVYGLFDPAYITSGDYEFWLRVSQTSRFHHIAEPLGLYLSSPASIEHANEGSKGRENHLLLSRYRSAAIAEKLLDFVPFTRLRSILASGPWDSCREEITALINFIDSLAVMASLDTYHEAPIYNRLKERMLTDIPCSHSELECFIRLAERLILNNSDWYTTSIQSISDEAILQGVYIRQIIQRARLHAMRGEVDTAIGVLLQQGIKVASADPAPYLTLMELLIAAGRFSDALEVVDQLPEGTDRAKVLCLRAVCHEKREEYDAAQQNAVEAFALAPDNGRVLTIMGVMAFHRNDKDKAARLFEAAMLAATDFGEPCANLGVMKWSAGEREAGLDLLELAVILSPLDNDIRTLYYGAASQCGAYGRAEQRFAEDAALYPDCRGLTLFLIDMLEKQHKYVEAMERLESALVRFGCDDDLLDAALAMRSQIDLTAKIKNNDKHTISLCMIVKDEARNLATCLASIKPVVNEMVVVDTGSRDRSIDIAIAFGAWVYNFAWNGNFSDARNFALSKANGAWILVMDADEVLADKDYEAVRCAVHEDNVTKMAWNVLTRNYTTRVNAQGWTPNNGFYRAEERAEGWHPSWKVRLFPHDKRLFFSGEIHELVEHALRSAGFSIREADFVVHHYGGLQAALNREKMLQYFELGKTKLEVRPDDIKALSELAVQAGELALYDEAVALWDRVLSLDPASTEAFFNKSYVYIGLKRYQDGLEASRRALLLSPDLKEAAFNFGTCALYVGDPYEAIAALAPLSSCHPDYPPLLAVLTALYLLTSQQDLARKSLMELQSRNYAIGDYISDRAATLDILGRNEMARLLRDGSTLLDINQS